MLVRVTYQLFQSGVHIGGLVSTLDLGSLLAQTTYKAAPSG